MFTRYYSNIILCLCYVSKMNTFKVKQCDTFVLNSGLFFFIRTEQTLQNFKSRNILHPSAIPPSMNAHVFIAKVWKQSILFYHRNNIPHFYALVIFFWGVELLNPCVKNMSILLHTSRISLILDPPFPMREPHWLAGTTNRRVTGGLGTVGVFCKSWNNIEPKYIQNLQNMNSESATIYTNFVFCIKSS